MRRRFMLPIIGSALAAGVFAACGSGGSNSATGTATGEAISTASASATAAMTTTPATTESAPTATIAAPTQAPAAEPTSIAPTQAPVVQPTKAPPPPPPPPPATQSRTVVAENIAFDPKQFTAAANVPLTITLDNRDAGVAHDIIVYNPDGSEAAETPVISGPATTSTTFTPTAPGTYRFKCSVHPQQMFGAISVQ